MRIELHLWNVTENITAFVNATYNVNGSYVQVKSNEVSILVQGKQIELSIYLYLCLSLCFISNLLTNVIR